jgi:hypothetical protein
MDFSLLDDEVIEHILSCPKRITNPNARWSEQKKSKQNNFNAVSNCGEHKFKVYFRQNTIIESAFSCGLSVETTAGFITLCRYNGSDHAHKNDIENERFAFQCHIHRATKRYIDSGYKPDKYAAPTTRYELLAGAVEAMAEDCNIRGLKMKGLAETAEMFPEGEENGKN